MIDFNFKSGSIVTIDNLEIEHKYLRSFMRELNDYLTGIIDNRSSEIYKSSHNKREHEKKRKHDDSYKIQFLESLKRNNGKQTKIIKTKNK